MVRDSRKISLIKSKKLILRKYIEKISNNGVKPEYAPWEIFLTRKLNAITLIALFNMSVGLVFFYLSKLYEFVPIVSIVLVIGPMVWVFNKYRNYIWAAYTFYLIGFVFFIFINLRAGRESYMSMFYFPVIISMVQLLGRKETMKHLIALGVLCILSVVLILVGYERNWLHYEVDAALMTKLIYFNIILSLFTALGFIIIVVTESVKQERIIKDMLAEKEILLAEVFHRVKNNMNIVTSLLNLKKNMSDSTEVRAALEDCRSRVYSMALVHHKIFNRDNLVELNFKEYVTDLVKELTHSLGADDAKVIIDAQDVNLNLINAIPCGLILNELITNAAKYAQTPNKQLEIHISIKSSDKKFEMQVRDNGPGIPDHAIHKFNSLGLELIKSLSDQIDGVYTFKNDNGFVYKLEVKL